MLLYLANDDGQVSLYNEKRPDLKRALQRKRDKPIVTIGAYSLMPNHYHLLIKETIEGGITKFTRKVSTGYTMYFNAKYERVGNLFIKPFRSRHVVDDTYFQRVVRYIHMNAAELYEHDWKSGRVKNVRALERKLIEYPYSSLRAYEKHEADPIVAAEGFEIVERAPFSKILREAHLYYQEHPELEK